MEEKKGKVEKGETGSTAKLDAVNNENGAKDRWHFQERAQV